MNPANFAKYRKRLLTLKPVNDKLNTIKFIYLKDCEKEE